MNPNQNQATAQPAPNETELAARAVAPRVTQADVDAAIVATAYYVFPETLLTVCCLTLRNGYTVTGESACASPENFQQDIGERLALANAVRKIWPLLGYALRERLQLVGPSVDYIARVCHEVNRAYCAALGDDSQPAWEDAPAWQRDSARVGVHLHVNNPKAGPETSHESWLAQKVKDGWVFGDVKDADAKTHPCMVPYNELPQEQQAKDYIFRAVVHALHPPASVASEHPLAGGAMVAPAGEGWPANKGKAPTEIPPTIGRVVWYYQGAAEMPMDAHICFIHPDGRINVGGFDHGGYPFNDTRVYLCQGDDVGAPDGGAYCRWMPYQIGQARKT